MNLPVAPPAFDATTGPRRRHRADRGADIAAACTLVVLELLALAVVFGLWLLSGIDTDTARIVGFDRLWGYLAAVGGVGLLAVVAAAIAARAGAIVTVVSQGAMAALVCVIVVGGTMAERSAHPHSRTPADSPPTPPRPCSRATDCSPAASPPTCTPWSPTATSTSMS